MKSLMHLSLFIAAAALVGCASSGPKPNKQSAKYQKNVVAFNSQKVKGKQVFRCPTRQKTYQKESWKKVMRMANDCVKKNKWVMTQKLGRHLATTEPFSPWGPYYLSLAAEAKGNHSKALWMVDLALKKAPINGLIHYQKGRVHWALEDYETSVTHFESAIKYSKNLIDAYKFLGQVRLRDHDFKKATKHFQKVLTERPKDKVSLTGLAECYEKGRNYTDALNVLDTAIFNYPRNLNIRLRQARLFETVQQNFPAALSSYKKIKRLQRQKRLPGKVGFNLEDKIKSLEAMIKKSAPGAKVSKAEGVKK